MNNNTTLVPIKISVENLRTGDVFEHLESSVRYVLCRTHDNENIAYALINVTTGNRWRDACSLQTIVDILSRERWQIIKLAKCSIYERF